MKKMSLMLGLVAALLVMMGCSSQPAPDASAGNGHAMSSHDYKGEHK